MSYSEHEIKILGTVNIEVSYKSVLKVLSLVAFEGTSTIILVKACFVRDHHFSIRTTSLIRLNNMFMITTSCTFHSSKSRIKDYISDHGYFSTKWLEVFSVKVEKLLLLLRK